MSIIKNLIFPPRCPMCDRVIKTEEMGNVCAECAGKVKYTDDAVCLKCGRKIQNKREEFCKSCRTRHHVFDQGRVVFGYEGAVRDSLHRFKYANRREYGMYYGRIAAMKHGDWIRRNGVELIVPVPLHKRKKRYRGYNQAEILARCLSKETGIPYTNDVIRVKNTKPQAGMDESERKNNLQNAFKISSDIVKYKSILVVDDIYTTGSTVDEIARVLLQEQAYKIYVLCIASGEG